VSLLSRDRGERVQLSRVIGHQRDYGWQPLVARAVDSLSDPAGIVSVTDAIAELLPEGQMTEQIETEPEQEVDLDSWEPMETAFGTACQVQYRYALEVHFEDDDELTPYMEVGYPRENRDEIVQIYKFRKKKYPNDKQRIVKKVTLVIPDPRDEDEWL